MGLDALTSRGRTARFKDEEYLEAEVTEAGNLLRPDRREPTAAEEAEILSVTGEERKTYAAERRR